MIRRGFTLIEILIVLTLLTIISIMTSTQMGHISTARNIDSGAQLLLSHIVYARSEALKRHQHVALCPGVNQCLESNQWHQGIIIFNDLNKNKRIDVNEGIIKRIRKYKTIHIYSSPHRRFFRYDGRGYSYGTNMTFVICQKGYLKNMRSVVISNPGKARISSKIPKNLQEMCK